MKKFIAVVMVVAMVAALGITASAADEIPQDGLVASFTFDDDLTGVTPTNATGDAEATLADEGHNGKAYDLGATVDEAWLTLTKADGTGLFDGVESFTFSYWSKNDALSTTDWGLFAFPNSVSVQSYPNEHYIGLLEKQGTVIGEFYDNEGARAGGTELALMTMPSEWNMITYVYDADSATATLYVNTFPGTPVTMPDDRSVESILEGDYTVWFGHANWQDNAHPNGEFGSGLVDDIVMYNRALTEEEVLALATAQGYTEEPDETEAPADDGTEAPADDEDETKAPADDKDETKAPAGNDGTGAAETGANKDEGGCGSTLGAAAAVVALTAVFGCAVVKKH